MADAIRHPLDAPDATALGRRHDNSDELWNPEERSDNVDTPYPHARNAPYGAEGDVRRRGGGLGARDLREEMGENVDPELINELESKDEDEYPLTPDEEDQMSDDEKLFVGLKPMKAPKHLRHDENDTAVTSGVHDEYSRLYQDKIVHADSYMAEKLAKFKRMKGLKKEEIKELKRDDVILKLNKNALSKVTENGSADRKSMYNIWDHFERTPDLIEELGFESDGRTLTSMFMKTKGGYEITVPLYIVRACVEGISKSTKPNSDEVDGITVTSLNGEKHNIYPHMGHDKLVDIVKKFKPEGKNIPDGIKVFIKRQNEVGIPVAIPAMENASV